MQITLGKHIRARIVKPIGSIDEKTGYKYPLNFAEINDGESKNAFIMGIDHPVENFDGRIIGAIVPKKKHAKKIWIIAPKSTRYINIDILNYLDIENDFPNYKLECLYESSAGAVIYREILGEVRFLLIKNKRSANWGFPKGHVERGETNEDAAKREILEETGVHVNLHDGFEVQSKYTINRKIQKNVSIFVGTTNDTNTLIQQEEIADYIWLSYEKALARLNFENDKEILIKAHKFLTDNEYI